MFTSATRNACAIEVVDHGQCEMTRVVRFTIGPEPYTLVGFGSVLRSGDIVLMLVVPVAKDTAAGEGLPKRTDRIVNGVFS